MSYTFQKHHKSVYKRTILSTTRGPEGSTDHDYSKCGRDFNNWAKAHQLRNTLIEIFESKNQALRAWFLKSKYRAE